MRPVILLHLDDWIELIGAFGTLAALAVAWLVHHDAQRTQRVMVRPYLSFETSVANRILLIETKNAGSGVGVITEIAVSVNGGEPHESGGQDGLAFWSSVMDRAGASPFRPTILKAHAFFGESVVAPSEKLTLLHARFDGEISLPQLLRIRDSMKVSAKYHSTFGEKFEATNQA